MTFIRIPILILLFLHLSNAAFAQKDSIIASITAISLKYIKETNSKIDKYSSRLTSKTEKTLEKLTKWETKIHGLIQKADHATAEKLFGAGKQTFASMLQKVKEGKTLADNYKTKYDEYTDKLTTNINYLSTQEAVLDNKFVKPLEIAKQKAKELEISVAETETAEALIKERKKKLLTEAYIVIGKSKYLSKINKEAYYYTETLKNYKELFKDPTKAEETAMNILNKIPAVKEFFKKNSMLSSLFGNTGGGDINQSLAGLQTRSIVNNLIQERIAQGGPNAAAQVSQNMQAAQAQLTALKDKIIKMGGGNGDTEIPNFKPNTQKTKTLKQRIEFGSNFQFGKPTRFQKSQADIGLSVGYKLNGKSTTGIGVAYKMGYGSIQNFNISHEGIGLRSFIDWKLKKQFFVSGGYEMNYNIVFTNLRSLQSSNKWQKSGLVGITKKIKIKTKYVKGTNLQLLYDVLHKKHAVPTQAVVFRVGYNF